AGATSVRRRGGDHRRRAAGPRRGRQGRPGGARSRPRKRLRPVKTAPVELGMPTHKRCEILPRLPEGRTLSYLKQTLNGRGGPRSGDILCGACSTVLMSTAPSRPIDLLISCPDCRAINDLTLTTAIVPQ